MTCAKILTILLLSCLVISISFADSTDFITQWNTSKGTGTNVTLPISWVEVTIPIEATTGVLIE